MDGQLLSETFVELTDTMVADFDIIGFLRLLHERSMRESNALNEQMQTALNSRVVIEQAKGKLAERFGLDTDHAFGILRDQARARNLRLAELAQSLVDGSETLIGPAADRPPRRRPGNRTPRPRPGPKPEG